MSFSDQRDYAEEQWQRDEAEREGLAELEAERQHPAEDSFAPNATLKDAPDLAHPEGEDDGEHCKDGWDEERYGYQMGGPTSCTDIGGGGECVHCECCCSCLGCQYGDRNSPPMTAEQRAPIAAFEATDGELAREDAEADEEPDFDDVPPNAGSAS